VGSRLRRWTVFICLWRNPESGFRVAFKCTEAEKEDPNVSVYTTTLGKEEVFHGFLLPPSDVPGNGRRGCPTSSFGE
jgi:hypothetical protein